MKRYRKILFMVAVLFVSMCVSKETSAAKSKMTLSFSEKKIEVGESVVLKLKNAKGKIAWKANTNRFKISKISNDKIKITGKRVGTGYITVSAKNKKFSCKIKVRKATLKIAVANSKKKDVDNCVSVLKKLGVTVTVIKQDCDIKKYDGLVLPGGYDINPKLYKQKNKASKNIHNKLDRLQYSVLDKFVQEKKPVLGICRGCQMINIYFGGTLNQDIKKHRGKKGSTVKHDTTIVENSVLESLYGRTMKVNSRHHQCIDQQGVNLLTVQRASDGRIEAVEHDELPILGVQWHPEEMGKKGELVINEFLKRCR